MDCDSISGAWSIEHSLSHCQLRGTYKLNFVLQYLCLGFLPVHIPEVGCEMCAVWVGPVSLVLAPVGNACIFQSSAFIYVPTLQFIILSRLAMQTKRVLLKKYVGSRDGVCALAGLFSRPCMFVCICFQMHIPAYRCSILSGELSPFQDGFLAANTACYLSAWRSQPSVHSAALALPRVS